MTVDGFQMLLAVVAVNACVLGIGFFAVYQFSNAVRQCGR
jgi:hypothetical protein